MARIVVAEDDPGTRKLLSVVLEKMGHEVLAAADGQSGWALTRTHRPDLVVSDVNMPGMSGFELLDAVRKDPDLLLTPFILLTSLQERKDMRQGMRMGADDYLTKPFQSRDLREAVHAQINKSSLRAAAQALQVQTALSGALAQQAQALGDDFEDRLALALNEQWPTGSPAQQTDSHDHATVLCVGVLNHAQWVQALSAGELGQVLKRFYENSGDTVFLFGASTLQFVGDGVVAVFTEKGATHSAPHSLRAVRAALGLKNATVAVDRFIAQHFPERALPRFEVRMALHNGPVAMMRLEGLLGGATQTVPVGETVVDTIALQRNALQEHGPITVSVSVLRSVTGAVRPLQRYLAHLPHRPEPMDVCAVGPLPA
jgi:CheY-like chemotaxis protein